MKVVLERPKCISCGSCAAVCPDLFEMAEDTKSHLKNSKEDQKTGNEKLEAGEAGCAQDAVDVCPVQIIHII